MKVDLQTIDRAQFYVNEHVLNGELVHLVIPQQIGCKWTQENKIFRSSLWNSRGELISAGFPKFTNWGELPEVFPVPTTLNGSTIVEKLDGSLLIVSQWAEQFILRTRGTVDARKLDNGAELQNLLFQEILVTLRHYAGSCEWPWSFLFEWTSPKQRIVLNYGDKPNWHLVGVVNHSDYSLWPQDKLDELALDLKFKRPQHYDFPSFTELIAAVEQWVGREGVCIYSNKGQSIHKAKSAWYLALHHMKSELASFEKVLDVWLKLGRPFFNDFYLKIATQFDFELANQIQGDMSRICDAYKEVTNIAVSMNSFATDLKLKYGDPKDKKARGQMAGQVFGAYGKTNRATFLFKLIDGKSLDDEDIKKLMFQVLKR